MNKDLDEFKAMLDKSSGRDKAKAKEIEKEIDTFENSPFTKYGDLVNLAHAVFLMWFGWISQSENRSILTMFLFLLCGVHLNQALYHKIKMNNRRTILGLFVLNEKLNYQAAKMLRDLLATVDEVKISKHD